MRADTPPMKLQVVSWICIAVNLASAGLYGWMIARTKRLRDRDKEALDAAVAELVQEFAPAVVFCAMMRDTQGVPDPIRKSAANAIPKNMEVHMEPNAQGKRVVH